MEQVTVALDVSREAISGQSRKAYRPRELARLYGLAPSTVYAAIYRDEIKPIRIGRAIVIPIEEVNRWLAAHTEDGLNGIS